MNALYTPSKLQVGIDIGSMNHSVAISDDKGRIVREFEIPHSQKGFDHFFAILDKS